MFVVKYRFFNGEWHEYAKAESMYEAKQIAKKLRKHMVSWDGKLHDTQIKIF